MSNNVRDVIPLLLIGYSNVLLKGIDNEQLAKDIIENKHLRLDNNPKKSHYEDTFLPDTVECRKLLSMIDYEVKKINPYLTILKEDRMGPNHSLAFVGAWSLILEPGQSTVYHEHDLNLDQRFHGFRDGIAFVYYVTYPENSGDLIFCVETLKRRIMLPVKPVVGNLVMFPTYLPHLTLRNESNERRISVSGNYFPDREKMDEFYKEISEGRSNYFDHVGMYNDGI